MNSVTNLIECPFTSRTLDEQLEVLLKGRPQPRLKELDPTNALQGFYRRFTWLCGCDTEKALFCFPCVLYGNKFEDMWSKSGFRDIINLTAEAEKHLNGHYHLLSNKKMDELLTDEAPKLREMKEAAFIEHKKEVVRTTRVLAAIVDSICYSITSHEAISCIVENRLFFTDLFQFLRKHEAELRRNYETTPIFGGNLLTIQSDLLQAILEVCHESITEEIQESNFLAVIIEDASEVCEAPCFSVVLRYLCGGKAVERFWSYVNHENINLAQYILEIMEKFKVNETPNKLIAQLYDGSPLLAGKVQKDVKAVYPRANYIHSRVFNIDTVMKRAVSDNREIRIFFANLKSICNFFSLCPEAKAMCRMLQRESPIQFPNEDMSLYKSFTIISENSSYIIKCMNAFWNEKSMKNYYVLSQASRIISILESSSFVFWLSFFRNVWCFVDRLSNVLLQKDIYFFEFKEAIKSLVSHILYIHNRMNVNIVGDSLPHDIEEADRKKQAKKACRLLISEFRARFEFSTYLIAEQLFNPDKYEEYIIRFPEIVFKRVCSYYNISDVHVLRRELELIYRFSEFFDFSSASDLYESIDDLGLSLPQTIRLIKILLIGSPSYTLEYNTAINGARRFPIKETTRQFAELQPLAMAMIEKNFIKNIPYFQEKVIQKFARLPDWIGYFNRRRNNMTDVYPWISNN